MKENKNLVANLNTYSHYSLLSSSLSCDDIIKFALDNKQKYVCLTDTNLYCAIEFYKKAVKFNLKPVIGLDINYKNFSLLIIAKNFNGYKNLIKISSHISKSEDFDLENYLSNVFIVNKIGSEYYANGVSIYTFDQGKDNRIAVNTAKYLKQTDNIIVTAMKYVLESKVVENLDDLDMYKNLELKNFSFLENNFDKVSIENLNKEILNVNLDIPLNEFHLIKYPIDSKHTSKTFLKKLCDDKLNQKIQDGIIDSKNRKEYETRIEYELEIINSMNFNDYFLIVQDFISYAKDNDIIVGPGRGSSSGSLVAFILGITEVDSLKYNLLFERFLNPGRVSMPDIDIDIMDTRRNEVIEYLFEKYGYNHVAHIVTFQRIKSKMAIRDIGRILNIDLKIINNISKLLSQEFDDDLLGAIKNIKGLKPYYDEYKVLFDISSKIIGAPRQTGLHAAGIVLSDVSLDEIVPTQFGANGENSTQFSMDYLEELGLLKMDLLGLTNLSTISNIQRLIKYIYKKNIDLNKINLEDKKVFDYLSKGNTIGIFQLESPGMTNLVKKLKPQSIEDISLCSAMFRPGPQQNIPSFLARRNKLEDVTYVHESLKDILEVTNGIIVYQEQVITIVQRVGNFTASEADIFRRIISKKHGDELDDFKKQFEKRALKNGYTKADFDKIYNYIYTFANYGFNHSHSIAYSLISYWLVYLKYYYKTEFMITLMIAFEGTSSKIEIFIEECKKLDIKVLPPNINQSLKNFSLKGRDILMGFNSIKGIGEETSKKIISARDKIKNKKFNNYIECVKELSISGVGQSTIETLIYAGMFDCFDLEREYMLLNLPQLIMDCKQIKKNGEFLFEPILQDVSSFKDRIKKETINNKFIELIGYDFFNENDILNNVNKNETNFTESQQNIIDKYNLVCLNDIDNSKEFVECLVKIKGIRKIKTKNGKDMAFISFIDNSSTKLDVACFNSLYLNDYFKSDIWYIVLLKTGDKGYQLLKVKEELQNE
ncbi:DNA polymerase III subunit alpha [Malacoplasma muris]|uniref:DNA polymerase III subunit alpha n=1 Tax=Malacoplasma muris TaxID=2119 RepID=UPI00398F4F35